MADQAVVDSQTGKDIKLQVSTKSGDRETVVCVPVGTKEGLAMAGASPLVKRSTTLVLLSVGIRGR